MIDFENSFPSVLTYFFLCGLILFCTDTSHISRAAQKRSKIASSGDTIDFSQPLKLCGQNTSKNNNSEPILSFASDNAYSFFVALPGGKIIKKNIANNSVLWNSNLGGQITSDINYEDNNIFFITEVVKNNNERKFEVTVTKRNYVLWSLNASTGITNWQFPFTANNPVSTLINTDKVFLTSREGRVTSVRKSDGKKNFEIDAGQNFSSQPFYAENKIYIGCEDNSIMVIAAETGDIVSKIPASQSPVSAITIDSNKIFWGDRRGFVNVFDASNNRRLGNIRFGGEISTLNLVPEGLLISSLDNFVYLITLRKGKSVWKKRLSGRILSNPLIIGSYAVFTVNTSNQSVILDLKSGKTVNQISLASKGSVISKPVVAQSLLWFLTTDGLISFTGSEVNCPQS